MKAVVVKIKGNDAVMLLDDGQFVMARNRDYAIGDEINIEAKSSYYKKILALAATAAVFVMMLTAAAFTYATPAYYVSIDINPSLVLNVNLFERIIGMEATNEDAETFFSSLAWKNKDIDEFVGMTVQRITQEGEFNNAGSILITAAGKSEARTAVLLAGLKEKTDALSLQDVSIQTDTVSMEMVVAAKEFGLTPGKYNLITKLLGETVTNENKEDYLNISVKDLMERFTAAKGSVGEEEANAARQSNNLDNLPKEAESGRQNSERKSSSTAQNEYEANEHGKQEKTQATQQTTDINQTLTDSLPADNNLPPATTAADSDDEINQPSVAIPADTPADISDVSDAPDIHDIPTSAAGQPLPAANANRP